MSAYEMPTDIADQCCCCADPVVEDTSAPLIEEPVVAEPAPVVEAPVVEAPAPVVEAATPVVEAPAPVAEAPALPEPNFGVTQVANTTQPSPEPAAVQNTAVVENYVPSEFGRLGEVQPQSSVLVENPAPTDFLRMNRPEFVSPGDAEAVVATHGDDVFRMAVSSQSPRVPTLESTYTYGGPRSVDIATMGLNASLNGPSGQRATYNASTGTSWTDYGRERGTY
jgi:hypothetical protein